MVGKLSDDRKMSGSRIPVLYCWKYADGHSYSTPNDELAKSIDAKNGIDRHSDIGEPGEVGNLLEPVLAQSCVDVLALHSGDLELTPPVVKMENFEISIDALLTLWPDVVAPRLTDGIVQCVAFDDTCNQIAVDLHVLSGKIPIEIKCTSDYPSDFPPLTRGVIQLQAQMMAVDASHGIIMTLHRGIERRIHIYERCPEIQSRIETLCQDFLNRVSTEEYYPPVSVDDAAIAPASDEKTEVDISPLNDDIARLERLKADRDAFNDEIASLELEIMKAIGDAHVGTTPKYRVEWPVRHYKAQPEKVTPAKQSKTIRLKSLKIKEIL